MDNTHFHPHYRDTKRRIRLKMLQLPKMAGGSRLPSLRYYFWAAQLKPMTVWIGGRTDTR